MTEINVVPGQKVLIEWVDSSMLGGWQYGDLSPLPKHIESAGFVCAISKEALTITNSRSSSGGVIAPLTIPFRCIIGYKLLDVRQNSPDVQSK